MVRTPSRLLNCQGWGSILVREIRSHATRQGKVRKVKGWKWVQYQ